MDIEKQRQQFIDWLCGEDVEFPFFKDMPEVPYPIGFEPKNGK